MSKEIAWIKKNPMEPGQVYLSGLEFCFVSKNYEQCHRFVYCKDFLQDAIHGLIYKKPASIYGFTYDSEVNPIIDLEVCRVALANSSDAKFDEKIAACLEFINGIEKDFKLKRTVFEQCSNPPRPKYKDVFVANSSKMWMLSPPMLSLYTLMLRIGFCHKLGSTYQETLDAIESGKIAPYQKNDTSFYKSCKKTFEQFKSAGFRNVFYKKLEKNYPETASVNQMHNSFGIVAFEKESPKTLIPFWFKKKTLISSKK